jgi:uncharacterized repeat protein (TIGR03847 family)
VGAVGPPGQRVFYLQARQEDQLMSLKLEKEQVLFLAGGLTEVMADLAVPADIPSESELELEQPVLAEWAVGSMQLAYDSAADRVLLVAREIVPDDEDNPDVTGETGTEATEEDAGPFEVSAGWSAMEDEGPGSTAAVARVALTREQAAGVIEHGKRLLRRGRPPCPLCGFPLSEDHSCPKTNGHRAPAL